MDEDEKRANFIWDTLIRLYEDQCGCKMDVKILPPRKPPTDDETA